MKNPIHVTCLLVVLLVAIGCKKKPFDYRNKFIGRWSFRVERTEFNTDSVGYYYHDTINYTGEINYGENDDEIRINYSSSKEISLKMSKENVLTNFPTHYCSGEFDGKDKIHLYLRWGGLGGGVSHIINGEKNN
jgi:hypothetical protein